MTQPDAKTLHEVPPPAAPAAAAPLALSGPVPGRFANIRDMVQIVAIVAAGCWAIYQFIYENKVKPALEVPQVVVVGKLSKVGEIDGLVSVRLDLSMRNNGHVEAHFLGYGEAVVGSMVSMAAEAKGPVVTATENNLAAYWAESDPAPIYRNAFVTVRGDKASHNDLSLMPSESVEWSRTFFVPRARFNYLQCYIAAQWIRGDTDDDMPTKLALDDAGRPRFEWNSSRPPPRSRNMGGSINTFIAALSL